MIASHCRLLGTLNKLLGLSLKLTCFIINSVIAVLFKRPLSSTLTILTLLIFISYHVYMHTLNINFPQLALILKPREKIFASQIFGLKWCIRP